MSPETTNNNQIVGVIAMGGDKKIHLLSPNLVELYEQGTAHNLGAETHYIPIKREEMLEERDGRATFSLRGRNAVGFGMTLNRLGYSLLSRVNKS